MNRASVVIVEWQGLVLAVARGGNLLDLGLPGGKAEVGELHINCAARELREETGLQFYWDYFVRLGTYVDNNTEIAVYGIKPDDAIQPSDLVHLQDSPEGKVVWTVWSMLFRDSCRFYKLNYQIWMDLHPTEPFPNSLPAIYIAANQAFQEDR